MEFVIETGGSKKEVARAVRDLTNQQRAAAPESAALFSALGDELTARINDVKGDADVVVNVTVTYSVEAVADPEVIVVE